MNAEAARLAHIRHTLNWYKNERKWIAQGRPNSNTVMKKHFNNLWSWMKKNPIHVNVPIYRGLKKNISNRLLKNKHLVNNGFPSFSKNARIARAFSGNNYPANNGIVIMLNIGNYPAMRPTNNKRYYHGGGEMEVTLAPGRFNLILNKNGKPVKNTNAYKVKYTPKN
jgi:hypothetical protein